MSSQSESMCLTPADMLAIHSALGAIVRTRVNVETFTVAGHRVALRWEGPDEAVIVEIKKISGYKQPAHSIMRQAETMVGKIVSAGADGTVRPYTAPLASQMIQTPTGPVPVQPRPIRDNPQA